MKQSYSYLAASVLAAVALFACSSSTPPPSTAATEPTVLNKDRTRAVAELKDATKVLQEISATTSMPIAQRERARCVLVAPSLVSGGLLVGASHGAGVVTCRTKAMSQWSAPAFVDLSGGSAGLQAGLKASDIVMLVNSERAMSKLFSSAFQLGADASVAAGPMGETAMAETDVRMDADILSYGRSRGLFAGVDVGGVWVSQDMAAEEALYGPGADIQAILGGVVQRPREATAFLEQIGMMFPYAPAPAEVK